MDTRTASDLGLVTNLVDVTEVDATIASLDGQGNLPTSILQSRIIQNQNCKIRYAFTVIAGNYPERKLSKGFDPEDNLVSRQLRSLSRTAPIALRMASDLIDATGSTELEVGLSQELGNLEGIFSTNGALEGLSALIEGPCRTLIVLDLHYVLSETLIGTHHARATSDSIFI